jgi:hypothetical protein
MVLLFLLPLFIVIDYYLEDRIEDRRIGLKYTYTYFNLESMPLNSQSGM